MMDGGVGTQIRRERFARKPTRTGRRTVEYTYGGPTTVSMILYTYLSSSRDVRGLTLYNLDIKL